MHKFRQALVPNLVLPPNPENNASARHMLAMVQPLAVERAPTSKANTFGNSIITFLDVHYGVSTFDALIVNAPTVALVF
jgi:hypothetical protein